MRRVKKYESGMVVDPMTIGPDATLADALRLMKAHKFSGVPVVEDGTGRLLGILTNRDVRFASDPRQPVQRADDARHSRTSRWSPCATASAATRRSGCCTSTGSRSCWWSTRTTAASA